VRIVWTQPAQQDLARIHDYFVELDPAFSDKYATDAIAAGRFLADNPYAGSRLGRTVRKWPVRRSPFILIYRVKADTVEILRVRHERENWRAQP
jgi:toxin ParE1/3/4